MKWWDGPSSLACVIKRINRMSRDKLWRGLTGMQYTIAPF
jgi:hypothetical protein